MPVERLPAPTGGMNTDASPEYLALDECRFLSDLLPGYQGKLIQRGPIRSAVTGMGVDPNSPTTFWAFDDIALIQTVNAGTKYYRVDVAGLTKSDVTGTLTKLPFSNVHARFGDFVFGAIQDANQPALGRWDGGGTNVVLQTNAPFKFTDIKNHLHRLFVLSGTVPGAGGATAVKTRTLYWTDQDASDLSVLTAWQDDTSGLVNQQNYDSDDQPVGLAVCGRWLAILGTRSINLLTGDGPGSFALRNVTKEYGCLSRESIVETTQGFYFMSDRGYAFCDGSSVTLVGKKLSRDHLAATAWKAAMQGNGYLSLWTNQSPGTLYLMSIDTGAWCVIGALSFPYRGAWRTVNFPVTWKNGCLLRTELVTRPGTAGTNEGVDFDGVSSNFVSPAIFFRVPKLAGADRMSQLKRVLVDYEVRVDSGVMDTLMSMRDWKNGSNGLVTLPSQTTTGRQRLSVETFLEVDTVLFQLGGTNSGPVPNYVPLREFYDLWIEFEPGRPRPSI